MNILDLDNSESIKEFCSVNTTHLPDTIYKLIDVVKKYCQYMAVVYRDTGDVSQYRLMTKYLDHQIPVTFEFDYSCQYVNMMAELQRSPSPPKVARNF